MLFDQMTNMVVVGGIPTPEMTAQYEAAHKPAGWVEELNQHLEETAPPVRYAFQSNPIVDTSDRLTPDFIEDFLNEVFGAEGVQWALYDENGQRIG